MASELTGLVVQIKADLKDYLAKLDAMEAQTDKTASGVSGKFKRAFSDISALTMPFASFVTTAVNSAMEWGKAVDDLSDKTGMAGEQSSELLAIGKRAGISTEETNKAFAKLSKTVYTASDSMMKANAQGTLSNDVLTRLGVSAVTVEGKTRPLLNVFMDIKDRLNEMPDGWQKTAIEMELFGKSGYEVHDMLSMTNEEINQTIDNARAMGLIISTETAAGWEKLDREINSAKQTLSATGIMLGNEIMPQLQSWVATTNDLTKAFTQLDTHQKEMVRTAISFTAEVGAATIAVKGLEFVLGRALGPWGLIAVATWKAVGALREWNIESQKTKRIQAGGSWEAQFTDTVDPVSGRTVRKYAGTKWVAAKPEDYWQQTRGKEISESYGDWGKETKVEDDETFVGGGGSTEKAKTALESYIDTMNVALDIAQKRFSIGEITAAQYTETINEQLVGLRLINTGESERNKQIETTLNLQKMRADFSASEDKKLKTRNDALFRYYKQVDSQQEQHEREQVEQTMQTAKADYAFKLQLMDVEVSDKREQLAILFADQERINREMINADEATLLVLGGQRAALTEKIKQLNREVQLDAAKAAKYEQQYWADMLSALITNTESAHDILRNQWYQFVNDVISQMWRINGETNLFKGLLGGIIGGGQTDYYGQALNPYETDYFGRRWADLPQYSAAGGWDVPDIPGDIPAVLHRKEMVLPADLADMVRNGSMGGGVAVSINPVFQSLDPAAGQQMFKSQIPQLISEVESAIKNKSSMRAAVKGAVG